MKLKEFYDDEEHRSLAASLAVRIILREAILDYSRLAEFALVAKSHVIDKIPEIWKSSFITDAEDNKQAELASFFQAMNEIEVSEASERLPLVMWYSLFIFSYQIFENRLAQVCNMLHQGMQYSLGLSDISGKGIRRSQVYLKKVAHIDLPDTENELQEINILGELRNLIVHNNGHIDSNNKNISKSLLTYIRDSGFIFVNEISQIGIDVRFILHAIEVYKDFLQKFCDKIPINDELYNSIFDRVRNTESDIDT